MSKLMSAKERAGALEGYAGEDLEASIDAVDTLHDFVHVQRIKKVVVQIQEDKLPEFEKHLVKFFKKHGYKATIDS
ncbi:hypothetical protein RMB03_17475 [Acinetobacter sp. V91_7]|uniref:hypothetical protein n=1 Tax=unclassified Acinetobacter TaxID=196816 RepID=UPI00287BED41|nr:MULTISPECIES: hypothetical protein [unclassified Acinetobacter]MDS7935652.1 hypothetical protein [Acinetobacter sp. V91_4B]MDS7964740.1 hypothetical protein [Acinetobacter sp. V91_7]MDS8025565.1 hypothetical protein [Acinetobacter sp. V91_13]